MPTVQQLHRSARSLKQRLLLVVATTAGVAVLAVGAPTAYATLADASARTPSASAAARGETYVETRLFFGTERPDGGPEVTERQFMAFIDRSVTPDFPEGLTVQEGIGQWKDSHGSIERERSYELTLLYPVAEAGTREAQIERIRAAYVRTYAQDSVARVDERTDVDF